MKKGLFIVGVFFLILLVVFRPEAPQVNKKTTVRIGPQTFKAEVFDTPSTRVLGLSSRKSLPQDEMVLFIFEKEDLYRIWMKDMNFPIDIMWLDKNKRLIHIEESVSPDTYPRVFYPTTKSLYVIETNSNFVLQHGIKIRDTIDF